MHHIYFRGKREDNHEWIIGSETCIVDKDGTWLTDDNDIVSKVDPHTVGIYTGKDDFNNNPVYEGDIVKSCDFSMIAVVRYNDDYACFELEDEDENFWNFVNDCNVWGEISIIGNIHDSPELLTGEDIRR